MMFILDGFYFKFEVDLDVYSVGYWFFDSNFDNMFFIDNGSLLGVISIVVDGVGGVIDFICCCYGWDVEI